jgi:hypothetical protein
MPTQLRPWYAPTTMLVCTVRLAWRDFLARSRPLRLAPWFFLFVLVCFVPIQAAGQEAGKGADLHYARGIISLEKKLWYEAIAEFTKAIEINPNNPWTYHNRGKAYYHTERYDQALADHEKAIQLKPDVAGFYEDRERAAKAKATSDWAKEFVDRAFGKGSNPQPTPESTAKTEKKASDGLPKSGEAPKPQPAPESKQPWQTSWTAFCSEIQRLYKSGTTQEKLDALFGGKPVLWEEGMVGEIDRAKNIIEVHMPTCHVTGADNRSAQASLLILGFHSAAEIPADLKTFAKVRFATAIGEPKFHPVRWETVEEKGGETQEYIFIGTVVKEKTKLLAYERNPKDPMETFDDLFRTLQEKGKQ